MLNAENFRPLRNTGATTKHGRNGPILFLFICFPKNNICNIAASKYPLTIVKFCQYGGGIIGLSLRILRLEFVKGSFKLARLNTKRLIKRRWSSN